MHELGKKAAQICCYTDAVKYAFICYKWYNLQLTFS